MKEEPYYDKFGVEIKEFDLIKMFHFKGVNKQGRGRKNYYQYFWVRIKDGFYIGQSLSNDGSQYFHLRGIGRINAEEVIPEARVGRHLKQVEILNR